MIYWCLIKPHLHVPLDCVCFDFPSMGKHLHWPLPLEIHYSSKKPMKQFLLSLFREVFCSIWKGGGAWISVFIPLVCRRKGKASRGGLVRGHVFMGRRGGDAKEITNILIILPEVACIHPLPLLSVIVGLRRKACWTCLYSPG